MHRWAVYTTCWLFDCRGQTFMNKDVLGLLKATESWHLLALPSFIKATITVCVLRLTTCKIIPVWKKRKIAERIWKYEDALWQVLRILECPHFAKTTTFVLLMGFEKAPASSPSPCILHMPSHMQYILCDWLQILMCCAVFWLRISFIQVFCLIVQICSVVLVNSVEFY